MTFYAGRRYGQRSAGAGDEVEAEVVGTFLFIASKEPAKKAVTDYASLLTLRSVDEKNKVIDIVPELF